ncbi:TPA: surface-adhesin E family protein [Burkholderia cepacia]
MTMKKSYLSIFSALLLASSAAVASQWVVLDRSTKNPVSVDVESISVEPHGIIKVWVKTEFTPPVRAGDKRLTYKLVRWTIDCVGHRVALGPANVYGVDGRVSAQIQGRDFIDIPPDSLGELVENNVCTKPNIRD